MTRAYAQPEVVAKAEQREREQMGMMAFLATDGGRRCPQCGRFAKHEDLGSIGGRDGDAVVSMYGHLPGRGCNA